mmetsp:Transcript_24307/g.36460  ORF Transcript_24307/g.36460 Transcript_24307/m.36460 type:complete len:335 (+) Transcript_24307:51-1055(+)
MSATVLKDGMDGKMSAAETEAAILLSMISSGSSKVEPAPKVPKEKNEEIPDAASTLAALEFSPLLKMKNHPIEKADVEIEALALSNSPITGQSCHQCKSKQLTRDLNWCSNMLSMQHGKKRPICRKKYCDRCLMKFLGEKPPRREGKKAQLEWKCPACRGICTCAACRRKKNKSNLNGQSMNFSPALESTPNLGSRRRRTYTSSPKVQLSPLPSASPVGKRKRSESLTEVLLARTAALALKTPQSAPFTSAAASLPIPDFSLGSRAESTRPDAGSVWSGSTQHRVAHISIATISSGSSILSQTSTMQSIQEKLRRLSELSDLGNNLTEEVKVSS